MTRHKCKSETELQVTLKESYRAQNSLELKLPSGFSLPFYAKQRTLSPKGEKKMDLKVDYAQLSAGPASLWPISRFPCPSHLKDN